VPEVGNIWRSAKRPRADEALGRDGTKLYGLINRMGTSVEEWLAGV